MGILNVTNDSFHEGSRTPDYPTALERAEAMIAAGADIIDVGGESTRPGADPVPNDVEIERVVPVVEALAGRVPISIDTRHAPVARAAVHAGANIINDVSASLDDVAAETGAGWVAMHMRGTPQSMQANPVYEDVVSEVLAYVLDAAERGRSKGVQNIWIDPGIGFGKTAAHNLALMAELDRFSSGDFPLLLGVSRKRFIGMAHAAADRITAESHPTNIVIDPANDITVSDALGTNERVEGSLALATWGILKNAAILRVHDVAETLRCCETLSASS